MHYDHVCAAALGPQVDGLSMCVCACLQVSVNVLTLSFPHLECFA